MKSRAASCAGVQDSRSMSDDVEPKDNTHMSFVGNGKSNSEEFQAQWIAGKHTNNLLGNNAWESVAIASVGMALLWCPIKITKRPKLLRSILKVSFMIDSPSRSSLSSSV